MKEKIYTPPVQKKTTPPAIKSSMYLMLLICSILIALIAWSFFITIHISERVLAQVSYPKIHVYHIDTPFAGTVKKLFIKQNQVVKKGQPLFSIKNKEAEASYNENLKEIAHLQAERYRLTALLKLKSTLHIPQEFKTQHPQITREQLKQFYTEVKAYDEAHAILKKHKHLIEKELSMITPLVDQGAVAELEKMRLEKELGQINLKLKQLLNDSLKETHEQLRINSSRFDILKEKQKLLKPTATATINKSPIDGVVHNLKIHHIGQYIHTGAPILDILPTDAPLYVKGKILPSKVGFIHEGQKVKIMIDAYDFTIYGSVDGHLERIAKDVIEESKDKKFFILKIALDKNYLLYRNKKLPIKPGMSCIVNVLTDKVNLFSYLAKPVIKTYTYGFSQR